MKQSRDSFQQVEILGHRGAKGNSPENTLVSFQSAIDAGVDMLELDVHLSQDNKLVVIHDPALARTTDGQGMVGDYDLKTLKSFNAAAKYTGPGKFSVQQIPALQEVFDMVGNQTAINIEIKTWADGSRYPEIEEQVVALIQENETISTTIVSSFDFPTIQRIQQLESGLGCYPIVSTKFFAAMTAEGKTDQDIVDDLHKQDFQQVAVNKNFLTAKLFDLLKQAEIKVGVWIINDVDEMMDYVSMGVDRITTDCPHLLVPAYRTYNPNPIQ